MSPSGNLQILCIEGYSGPPQRQVLCIEGYSGPPQRQVEIKLLESLFSTVAEVVVLQYLERRLVFTMLCYGMLPAACTADDEPAARGALDVHFCMIQGARPRTPIILTSCTPAPICSVEYTSVPQKTEIHHQLLQRKASVSN